MNNMKELKTLIALLGLCITLSVGISACSDDDEIGSSSDIIGTWVWVSSNGWIKEDGEIIEEWEDNEGDEWMYNTFYEDGTIEIIDISDDWEVCDSGTWEYKNGNLHIIIDGESSILPILSLTSTEMVVGYHEKEKEDGVTYEYYEAAVYKKVK